MQASIVWTREKGIVSLSLNGNINIIDPAAPGSAKTIEAHQTGISALFYEPSTSTLYTGMYVIFMLQRYLFWEMIL
jgi:hypothetical protein